MLSGIAATPEALLEVSPQAGELIEFGRVLDGMEDRGVARVSQGLVVEEGTNAQRRLPCQEDAELHGNDEIWSRGQLRCCLGPKHR